MDNTSTKIGKDVIESLTLGMYEDSRFIFREYIQNSADQIDEAVEQDILDQKSSGIIEIEIECTTKSITISDNATGIPALEVHSVLKDIAKSKKDRAKHKGFRGIGRLGGLAYCDKLIFETSYKGEPIKSTLVWDSQKLKSIINNRSTKEEASAVIDLVTEFMTAKEDIEKHFFRVILENVSNKELLDSQDVYQYLTMVAPVPYNKGFFYKEKIFEKAKELSFEVEQYQLFVNKNQVFKSYTTSIYDGENGYKKKIDEVHDIETFELRTSTGQFLGWGWFSISGLIKQMPAINTARGIRLRKGNIQIGLEDTLDKLFKEARWSKYYFGEVYAVSAELIPNARRDYFLENSTLKEFEKLLKIKFNELQKLNYFSSNIRSEKRKLDELVELTKEYNEKAKVSGFTNNEEKLKFQEQLEVKKEKASEAKKELLKIKESNTSASHQKIYQKIIGETGPVDDFITEEDISKTKYLTDDISKMNKKDRKLVSKILTIIDSVLVKDLADNLKHKIIEELNK